MSQANKLGNSCTFKFEHQPVAYSTFSIPIIDLVSAGKLTVLNSEIQKQKLDDLEVSNLVNLKDQDGKTALFYACYYNFQNIVLYLLHKGADPLVVDSNGTNIFHIMCYFGRYECMELVLNYDRHSIKQDMFTLLKQIMREFKVKRSDVVNGVLVSPDCHIPLVRQMFSDFYEKTKEMMVIFYNKISEKLRSQLDKQDFRGKNPIHYAAFSKQTKQFIIFFLKTGFCQNNHI